MTTIESAFAEEDEDQVRDTQRRNAEKRRAREHRVVPVLIPDYLNTLEEAEVRWADLDARVKAAIPDSADDESADAEETVSPSDLKRLKADLASAKRQVKRLENEFVERLRQAVVKLNAETEESLVMRILRSDLQERLDSEIEGGRRALIDRYSTWANKYGVALSVLEDRYAEGAVHLNAYLTDLGYA